MWNFIQTLSSSRTKTLRTRQYNNVDYTQLTETENGFVDSEFAIPPIRMPWRRIFQAALFLFGGFVLIIIGSLFLSGQIQSSYSMWPLIILGILLLIPGSYNIKAAMKSYRKLPGLTFDDIPDFE